MICHTYACRKGKGTHAAARYAFSLAKKSDWFLKLDVRKYFDSVNHSVLKMQLCLIIKDARCLNDMVIFASPLTELQSAFSAIIMPARICLLQKSRRRMNRTLKKISEKFFTCGISEEKAASRMSCVYSCRRIVKKI